MARVSPAREAERIQALERRRQVMELRVQGHTIGVIAERLSLSKSTVHGHIKRALDDAIKADVEGTARWRQLSLTRMETVLNALWPHATGQVEVRSTTHHKDGATTETVTTTIDVKAAREVRQMLVAINRLLGLEAPIKITNTDLTGDIERTPHDWIMPVPPERDPHEWAQQTQKMLAGREALAESMVEELLASASKASAE